MFGHTAELNWQLSYGSFGVQLIFMISGFVNADIAGAIIYQSTVKPISCTIIPLPTDLSGLYTMVHGATTGTAV